MRATPLQTTRSDTLHGWAIAALMSAGLLNAAYFVGFVLV